MLDVLDFVPVDDFDRFSLGKRPKRPSQTSPWADPDRVDELKRRWASGETCSVIAAELGGGITRNSVIGKLHRLGLKSRDNDIRARNLRGRPQNIKGRIPRSRRGSSNNNALGRNQFSRNIKARPARARPLTTIELFDAAIPRERIKSLMDRGPAECCWPIGDPREPDFGFCCAATGGEQSYCADHLGYMHERRPAQRSSGRGWGCTGEARL
jgi:GcrA cell cycle regulator